MSGVDPTRSSSDAGSALTATGHRRQEDQLIAVAYFGVEPVARADVLATDIDVHEVCELAVAQELVTAHGGTIRLLDAAKGAAFEIDIPDRDH